MNTSPPTPPNTGDTDIENLIKRIMVDCIDNDGVTEKNLLHFTNYGLDFKELQAAITKKLRAERLDELKQLGFDKRLDNPIIYCGGDNPITFAERMAELQAEETS